MLCLHPVSGTPWTHAYSLGTQLLNWALSVHLDHMKELKKKGVPPFGVATASAENSRDFVMATIDVMTMLLGQGVCGMTLDMQIEPNL